VRSPSCPRSPIHTVIFGHYHYHEQQLLTNICWTMATYGNYNYGSCIQTTIQTNGWWVKQQNTTRRLMSWLHHQPSPNSLPLYRPINSSLCKLTRPATTSARSWTRKRNYQNREHQTCACMLQRGNTRLEDRHHRPSLRPLSMWSSSHWSFPCLMPTGASSDSTSSASSPL
jgi:hypothetical protein